MISLNAKYNAVVLEPIFNMLTTAPRPSNVKSMNQSGTGAGPTANVLKKYSCYNTHLKNSELDQFSVLLFTEDSFYHLRVSS